MTPEPSRRPPQRRPDRGPDPLGHPRHRLDRVAVRHRPRPSCPTPSWSRSGPAPRTGPTRSCRAGARPGACGPTRRTPIWSPIPRSTRSTSPRRTRRTTPTCCWRSRPARRCCARSRSRMNAGQARELVDAARARRDVPDGGDVDPLPAAHRQDPRAARRRRAGRGAGGLRRPRAVVRAQRRAPAVRAGARRWGVARPRGLPDLVRVDGARGAVAGHSGERPDLHRRRCDRRQSCCSTTVAPRRC